MERMIWNAQKIFNLNKQSKSDLLPSDIIDSIRDLSKRLVIVSGNDRLSTEAQYNATMLFNIHLRSMFCSKRVIDEYFLNSQASGRETIVNLYAVRRKPSQNCVFVQNWPIRSVQPIKILNRKL